MALEVCQIEWHFSSNLYSNYCKVIYILGGLLFSKLGIDEYCIHSNIEDDGKGSRPQFHTGIILLDSPVERII